MKKSKIKIMLFVLLLSIALPFLLYAQQNPGDAWFIVPQGIQIGEQFQVELHLNSGDQRVAYYSITVLFDSRFIYADTPTGSAVIEEGPDGYISAVSTLSSYLLLCTGFDARGTGPGSDLHFLTYNFIARAAGPSILRLEVDGLVDETTKPVGTANGINACITVGSNGIAGDANQSGEISIVDALLVAQYYTYTTLSVAIDTSVTDVNQDGNIDIVDALLIAQYYVGLIGPLPITGTPGPPIPTGTPDGTPTPSPQVIYFPDPELDAAIRYDLMIPTGENIYLHDVENVDYLHLSYDSISDLTGMEYFTSLTHFYCGNNKLTNITPLAQLTALTRLDLQDNDISDISPLAQLTKLTSLTLSGNSISDTGPLSQLINITGLFLTDNNINDLSPLAQLININSLYLENNNITDITPLFGLIQISILYLGDNPLTQADIDALEAALPDAFIMF